MEAIPFKEHYEEWWTEQLTKQPGRTQVNDCEQSLVREYLKLFPSPSQRILDIGCGLGGAAQMLAEAGKTTFGIDISETAIARARQLHPQIEFKVCSADTQIDYPQDSFDEVFSIEVIEHIFDIPRFFDEIKRILKPGGYCFISTPFHGVVKNLIISMIYFDQHFDPLGEHIRFFTPSKLKEAISSAGFEDTRTFNWGRFPPVWRALVGIGRKPSVLQESG